MAEFVEQVISKSKISGLHTEDTEASSLSL